MRSGDVLDKRYQLLAPLDAGAQATVWRATDLLDGRVVAAKVYSGLQAEERARVFDEALRLARCAHPRVVPIEAVGAADVDQVYLVMPLLAGGNLAALSGTLSALELVKIGLQVCDGLIHLHELGLLHRDIKPSNLLLNERGDVVIADLGISRRLGDPRPTQTIGTPGFAPPEQIGGVGALDGRADVYALGMTLRALWRDARHPDPGRDAVFMATWIDRMTQAAPLDRPSVREVLLAFGAWWGDTSGPTAPPSAEQTQRRVLPRGVDTARGDTAIAREDAGSFASSTAATACVLAWLSLCTPLLSARPEDVALATAVPWGARLLMGALLGVWIYAVFRVSDDARGLARVLATLSLFTFAATLLLRHEAPAINMTFGAIYVTLAWAARWVGADISKRWRASTPGSPDRLAVDADARQLRVLVLIVAIVYAAGDAIMFWLIKEALPTFDHAEPYPPLVRGYPAGSVAIQTAVFLSWTYVPYLVPLIRLQVSDAGDAGAGPLQQHR